MYVPNRVSSLRRDVKLSRASNFYTLGSFNPEEWDITTFKNYPISGYLQVKGKLKWFALQGDRLCWFKEKGDTNRKGFWLLSTLQRIRYSFEIDSTEENVGIVVSLVDSSGRTSEVYLGMPSNEIDDARHWYDVLSWACFGFLKSDTEEGSAPKEITAPRPFSGWLKRKTANGWKSRHFLALAHQVKWYNTEQTSRENLMGFLSMFSITGIFDGLVKGKLHPCLLEMEIQKSKTDCVFFIERSFSKEPLYLLAPSKQVKLIWLDVLTRLHKYFSSLPGSYEEPMSDIDNDDAKEVLAVERAKLESLMSFVPMIVIKRFLADPTVLVEPESERLPNSAVLFADISGFTTLAERLAKKGEAEGAEILCKHLNAYFGKLVEIIHKNGGDVIKYAGDALLALWYNGPAWLTAMCATQCGLDMQTHTAKYSADSVTLTLHIGVASGAVTGKASLHLVFYLL
ncbi:uncharacterized protein LOC135145953 [Zophobas morio]|uniref:uncharacterized protein LOC135145953 n=1 Tax=Zophobas morio TaxID=2755281 RepID=UPI003083D94C